MKLSGYELNALYKWFQRLETIVISEHGLRVGAIFNYYKKSHFANTISI